MHTARLTDPFERPVFVLALAAGSPTDPDLLLSGWYGRPVDLTILRRPGERAPRCPGAEILTDRGYPFLQSTFDAIAGPAAEVWQLRRFLAPGGALFAWHGSVGIRLVHRSDAAAPFIAKPAQQFV
ncbi:MAG: hypothetical protein ACPGID_02080 [Rubricella sp.]